MVLGKFLGITGATWLAIKTGIAKLPNELKTQHLIGVGLLGGIGFTMSIFIADLGFASEPQILLEAKTGVITASLISGLIGMVWLWFCSRSVVYKE